MYHTKECNWIKSNCVYKKTHQYCPHEEHACDCKGEKDITLEEYIKNIEEEFEKKIIVGIIEKFLIPTIHGVQLDPEEYCEKKELEKNQGIVNFLKSEVKQFITTAIKKAVEEANNFNPTN